MLAQAFAFVVDELSVAYEPLYLQCIRAGGPGPAIHIDICTDDAAARDRALRLFELWPLAVKVDVSEDERHFEVLRPSS